MSKVYVFDMDGTLIDSTSFVIEGIRTVLDRYKIKYDDDMKHRLTPLGYVKSAEYLTKEFSLAVTAEEMVEEFMEVILPLYRNDIKIDKDIKDYLFRLRADGARIFLFTASPHILVEANLKSGGVYEVFERVFAVDDFGLTKANPEIYSILAEKIGVPTSSIEYFDDSLTALRNAKASGYRTHAVCDVHTMVSEDIMRSEFDEFIPSLSEYAKRH